MSVNSQNRGRRRHAELSIFHDRLSRLAALKHNPAISGDVSIDALLRAGPHAFSGLEVDSALVDGEFRPTVMLGPQRQNKSADVFATAIPLDMGRDGPDISDDGKVYQGGFKDAPDGTLLLSKKPDVEGAVTRIFRTGLIRSKHARADKGNRLRDQQLLRKLGIKPAWHGIFALERDTSFVRANGETTEVLNTATVSDLTDPKTRRFRGIDVAESREMAAEMVPHSMVLCADLGFLTLHERRGDSPEITISDVSDDDTMWKLLWSLVKKLQGDEAEAKAKALIGGAK